MSTCTCGFRSLSRRFADSFFDVPTSLVAVQQLPLQVAEVDDVEVDDADAADAGGGEVHRGRRPEPAGADAEHAARLEPPLPVHADLRHDQVTAVALDFVGVSVGSSSRRARHDLTSAFALGGRATSAGDGRHDAQRVARLHRRLLLLQVADVFVVQVHVDEVPQLALVGVEVLLQSVVPRRQVGQQFADGGAADFHGFLLVGERPQRGRDVIVLGM